MKTGELLGAALFVAAGAVVTLEAADLGVGSWRQPGSGFMLMGLGVAMIAMAIAAAGVSVLATAEVPIQSESTRWGKVAIAIAILVGFVAALPLVGFAVASCAMLALMLRLVDPAPWLTAIGLSLGAPLAIWLVFERLLAIRLPPGSLWGG